MAAPDDRRYAVILPACNEEACIGPVLAELRSVLDPQRFVFAVGVNGSRDRTAVLAREQGALVGETAERGYGHGCRAAIAAVVNAEHAVAGYIFVAADGANDPRDIPALIAEHARGFALVLGSRTREPANWSVMNAHYILANRVFGLLVGLLTGRAFSDLGPLRLIDRELFDALDLRELHYGWTIEAQVRAVELGAATVEIPVRERPRLAGEQKVGRVSWQRTLSIGLKIAVAGVRTRFTALRRAPAAQASRPEER